MTGSNRKKMIILLSILQLFCFGSACFAESNEPNVPAAKKSFSGGLFELSYKSKIDGSVQPFLVKVPQNYNPREKWPLLVTLHGLGGGPLIIGQIDSMVQIGPFGRGAVWYSAIGREDVFECLDVAKELFSIDPDRIYLCGFSMGGAGTFALGLGYPDLWAACVPVCGKIDDANMVANGLHLPFWINTGRMDTVLPPRLSKRAYDRAVALGFNDWHYTEYPNMGHAINIDWDKIEQWLLTKKRAVKPSTVRFTTKNLNAYKAYWAEITGIEKYGINADITAAIAGRKVTVDINNVSGYLLRLADAPIDISKKIEIIENGKRVFKGLLKDPNGIFQKSPAEVQIHP